MKNRLNHPKSPMKMGFSNNLDIIKVTGVVLFWEQGAKNTMVIEKAEI
jgi:hypothetical protein